jgi:transposase-like protein
MSNFSLTTEQLQVINALSSGETVTQAAAEAGVHRNTINHWRRNFIPFQKALADAQYDRALYFREHVEALMDTAIQTLRDLLVDPRASSSVRLKAALAVIQAATVPPEPKSQTAYVFEPAQPHNSAQTAPPPSSPEEPAGEPECESELEILHNFAQHTNPEKIGRNEPCPCGSGQKYKRCCLNKPKTEAVFNLRSSALICG